MSYKEQRRVLREGMRVRDIKDYVELNARKKYMIFGGALMQYLKYENKVLIMSDGSPVPENIFKKIPKRFVDLSQFKLVQARSITYH